MLGSSVIHYVLFGLDRLRDGKQSQRKRCHSSILSGQEAALGGIKLTEIFRKNFGTKGHPLVSAKSEILTLGRFVFIVALEDLWRPSQGILSVSGSNYCTAIMVCPTYKILGDMFPSLHPSPTSSTRIDPNAKTMRRKKGLQTRGLILTADARTERALLRGCANLHMRLLLQVRWTDHVSPTASFLSWFKRST